MAEKLAVDGGPKSVTNKLAGWPCFDEKAIGAANQLGLFDEAIRIIDELSDKTVK